MTGMYVVFWKDEDLIRAVRGSEVGVWLNKTS